MGILSAILRGILYVYICLYILMYLGFVFIIDMAHTSLSVTSVFVVVMPFVLLVVIQKFVLRTSVNRNTEKKQMLGVMIVGCILLLVCTAQLSMNTYNSKFNQDRWLHAEENRVHMVDDLLQKYKLTGKSNEEITKLLGAPTETRNEESGVSTVYYLGNERGFISIDSEQLVLQFDKDGKVVEYKVHND
ncbi:outer membrane protein assembly factor BamE [Bacillus tropicus]|uniref:Outer membrane protein assembly factor BamE n=1 Tax=Bacillus shihchuchen TaxID=3036942 RepID=A0ABT7KTZ6_9BACI|nr:outer membrane protein assembly factor BamE [Bacillus tropicus]MDL2417614.1 outer membrane protein assembly factor BamE [Bacillus shihchuchen]WBO89843.1 outer membrane protein assembly factor BamE [Bacillus tropicus]